MKHQLTLEDLEGFDINYPLASYATAANGGQNKQLKVFVNFRGPRISGVFEVWSQGERVASEVTLEEAIAAYNAV